ncbi:hypothetical protein ACFQPA_18090 [Halomarina halobia]|uniref:Uncharacterized protein n=1 Tax=Halomarina halobia TaxID=3033386 RepID=A0ABD6AE19_9EURY|nr:hypothetical protein [Halomarina sp. PSR21]
MYRVDYTTIRTALRTKAENTGLETSGRSDDTDGGIVLDYGTIQAGIREVNRRSSVADEIDAVTSMY